MLCKLEKGDITEIQACLHDENLMSTMTKKPTRVGGRALFKQLKLELEKRESAGVNYMYAIKGSFWGTW